MNKKSIPEIYYLRAFGCLAVCFHHIIGRLADVIPNNILSVLYVPASIGTPIFVFISIFLLSTFYFDFYQLKPGFLRERARYILFPFFCFGIIYSTLKFVQDLFKGDAPNYLSILYDHIVLAHWHGYFLLIIFQFIMMFMIQNRLNFRITLKHVLFSIVISALYWTALHHEIFSLPGYLSWVVIFGWLYVYCLGFYCGSIMSKKLKYQLPSPLLKKYKLPTWAAFISLAIIISGCAYFGIIELRGSKNIWAMLLCIMVIVSVFHLKIGSVNSFLQEINKYSFTIYLANPLFLGIFAFIQAKIQLPNLIYIPIMIIASIGLPMILGYFANKTKYGPLMFGKTLNIVKA